MTSTTKKNDNSENFVSINGFNGPYRNQYLKGLVLGAGIKRFSTLNEAIEAAKKRKTCYGITLTRIGNYELRKGTELKDSDPNNRFKSIEITWIKNEDELTKLEEKKPRKIIKKRKKINVYSLYKSRKPNPECFEIIKIKGIEYYYNISRRELRDVEGNIKGHFIRGKVVFN